MSQRDELQAEPFRFDLFRVLRDFERASPDKPRIGDSTVVKEEVVSLAQDPFVAFPASNLSGLETGPHGIPRLHARFLGFLGPQGALPLATTLEAYEWSQHQDPSFARFLDLFSSRFLQLFYRAWADARPIAQFDRPADDRFQTYVGSAYGIGSAAFAHRDGVEDVAKLAFAGMAGSRIKSARRLCQLIRGVLQLDAEIVERVGSWLVFEPSDLMALGSAGASLGVDTFLGKRSYSIGDKFRICIRTRSLDEYQSLLPNGEKASHLADLVFSYVGYRFEYDVELALPARLAPPTQLGGSGQLGWTSWIAPPAEPADSGRYLRDARFNLVERRQAAAAEGKPARKAGSGR